MKFTSEFLLTDEEIIGMGIKKSDVEMYRRKHYQDSFGIDSWYENLKEHTFPTISVPMTFSEGEALIKMYHKSTGSSLFSAVTIEKTDLDAIASLEKKMDDVLKNMQHGAFVKLNTRSPKDVPHL